MREKMANVHAINHAGQATLSFKQLDELNGVGKGTTFRVFKRWRGQLTEQVDYFYLPGNEHEPLIEALKASGRIYRSTTNLVLFTRDGYERLRELSVG